MFRGPSIKFGERRAELFFSARAIALGESGEGFSSCDEACEEIVVPGGGHSLEALGVFSARAIACDPLDAHVTFA
jgi:hypothetical protein